MRSALLLLFTCFFLAYSYDVIPNPDAGDFTIFPLVSLGANAFPTVMEFSSDGRIFVGRKGGIVNIIGEVLTRVRMTWLCHSDSDDAALPQTTRFYFTLRVDRCRWSPFGTSDRCQILTVTSTPSPGSICHPSSTTPETRDWQLWGSIQTSPKPPTFTCFTPSGKTTLTILTESLRWDVYWHLSLCTYDSGCRENDNMHDDTTLIRNSDTK